MEKPLTQHIKTDGKALSLKEYKANGGYLAIQKTLKMLPAEVTGLVRESNLKGRGGAGFSTGAKWSFVPMGEKAPQQKYFIANADEMEPGTFKDRLLLETNPHQLIEGMIIGSYAIQASKAYIFIRAEYSRSHGQNDSAVKKMDIAIREAYEAGFLGDNILGTRFSLHMYIHTSVGRYMCGEETGLINALEGKRAQPRAKPPFPQTSGLYGKPTIVNNIETICCLPHIMNRGAEWFNQLSKTPGEGGTKLYGVSGRVNNPGLWELPLGTTMREIIENYAGGLKNGYKFKGALPGGASTDFLTTEHLDVKMDFSAPQKAGSRLGTGTIVVLDDQTCPVGMLHNIEHFFAQESCGWCTPCREGLPWTEKTLKAIEDGDGKPEDLDLLEMHTRYLGPGNTFCALAPGAMEPLKSALKYFRDDFEKHIKDKHCPYKPKKKS